jgi:aryl-alcohol dehydrogenase-like predicted oxidoreductase
MDYHQLGTSELHVSSICLGTMTFGQQNSEDEAHAQLNYAFANGVNFIDTAEMYPVPFRTETIVGHWLKNYPRLG